MARAKALRVKTSQGADADATVLLAITFLLPVRSRVHRTESRFRPGSAVFPADRKPRKYGRTRLRRFRCVGEWLHADDSSRKSASRQRIANQPLGRSLQI
jgi:hypothetical protein